MLVQLVAGLTSPPSEPIPTTWDGLATSLTTIRPEPTLWRPGIGPTRKAESIDQVHALVLDYDRHTSLERILAHWGAWQGVAHTSKSATRGNRRWRVVVRLDGPVQGSDWRALYQWVLARDASLDRSTSDPSRVWWAPIRGSFWHAESWHGGTLDTHAILAPPEPPPRRRTTSIRLPSRPTPGSVLWTDPGARATLALELGGETTDTLARHVKCPRCLRRSVWFVLAGGRARCDHANSCAWRGWVDQLEIL